MGEKKKAFWSSAHSRGMDASANHSNYNQMSFLTKTLTVITFLNNKGDQMFLRRVCNSRDTQTLNFYPLTFSATHLKLLV